MYMYMAQFAEEAFEVLPLPVLLGLLHVCHEDMGIAHLQTLLWIMSVAIICRTKSRFMQSL